MLATDGLLLQLRVSLQSGEVQLTDNFIDLRKGEQF